MYDLRRQIFGHLQRLQLSYYDRNPVGRMVTRLTTDVDVLNDLFASGVVAIFGDIFTLLSRLFSGSKRANPKNTCRTRLNSCKCSSSWLPRTSK
jgi:ABC-type multidrug transport system fused ATPase/permease subunit